MLGQFYLFVGVWLLTIASLTSNSDSTSNFLPRGKWILGSGPNDVKHYVQMRCCVNAVHGWKMMKRTRREQNGNKREHNEEIQNIGEQLEETYEHAPKVRTHNEHVRSERTKMMQRKENTEK